MKEFTRTTKRGAKYYYKDKARTILHREDGPAIEYPVSGANEWWLNGKLHRMDGPATDYKSGAKSWYINGVFIFAIDAKGKVIKRMK